MSHHRYIPEYHDTILRDLLLRWKRTDMQIASEMGFSLCTIRGRRMYLDLPANARPLTHYPVEKTPELPLERPSPVTVALTMLSGRVVEKPSGYWLDGRPVNLDTMMQETNRVRVERGMQQIAGSDRWKVPE